MYDAARRGKRKRLPRSSSASNAPTLLGVYHNWHTSDAACNGEAGVAGDFNFSLPFQIFHSNNCKEHRPRWLQLLVESLGHLSARCWFVWPTKCSLVWLRNESCLGYYLQISSIRRECLLALALESTTVCCDDCGPQLQNFVLVGLDDAVHNCARRAPCTLPSIACILPRLQPSRLRYFASRSP